MTSQERMSLRPAVAGGATFSATHTGLVSHSPAVSRLVRSVERSGSLLSVGLEPSPAYLPSGFADDLKGHERFLRLIIDATRGRVAAYKFNLAFFESLGPAGWDLLFRVRQTLPEDAYIIADAKRGDIGTTAEHYARALYERLGADGATVNPLMGRDACEPFLAYEDRLTFFLVLTSNPGAADFLSVDGLYSRIASRLSEWNTRGNIGMVVGATRSEQVAEVRAIAGAAPFLIPGIGAQGGDLEGVARSGRTQAEMARDFPGLVFHVTRGVLPAHGEPGDPAELIAAKCDAWNRAIRAALSFGDGTTERSGRHVDR